jgi:hypothetical protein
VTGYILTDSGYTSASFIFDLVVGSPAFIKAVKCRTATLTDFQEVYSESFRPYELNFYKFEFSDDSGVPGSCLESWTYEVFCEHYATFDYPLLGVFVTDPLIQRFTVELNVYRMDELIAPIKINFTKE